MAERPIIFSGAMVQAILEGRKTQTRRPLRNQDPRVLVTLDQCPYGQPGDLLWVRERHLFEKLHSIYGPPGSPGSGIGVVYSDESGINFDEPDWRDVATHEFWRPSIYMPKWASRIRLLVENVWLERLQEISEADAVSEIGPLEYCKEPVFAFSCNWNATHAKRGYPFDSNPMVWVVEFSIHNQSLISVTE